MADERKARLQAEADLVAAQARAAGAEAMVEHLKLLIAKLRRERFGQSSERGQKLLDQLELQLEELEAAAAEEETKAELAGHDDTVVRSFGACTVTLEPLYALIHRHVLAAERLHGDDTTVPVLAKKKAIKGRIWTYVRDDRPFGGPDPPAAVFFYGQRDAIGTLRSVYMRRRMLVR